MKANFVNMFIKIKYFFKEFFGSSKLLELTKKIEM